MFSPREELRILTELTTARSISLKLLLMVMKRDLTQRGERSELRAFVSPNDFLGVTIYFHKQSDSGRRSGRAKALNLLEGAEIDFFLFVLRSASAQPRLQYQHMNGS